MGLCSKELLYALPIILTPFTFGYIIGYSSPAVPYYTNKFSLSSFEGTAFNAVSPLLACAGPYLTAALLKYVGRRIVVVILGIINIILWACLFAIVNKKMFYFGIFIRACLGIVLGANSAIGPLYLVEIAPPDYVGFYGTMNQMTIVLGIIILFIIGQYYQPWALHILAIVTAGIQLATIWFVPETSPLYTDNDVDNEEDDDEEDDIKESIFDRQYIKKVIILILVMVSQQFSGANALITNLSSLFEKAKVPIPSGVAAAITMVAQLIACIVGGLLDGKVKRRIMWIISCTTCFLSLLIYALNQKFNWNTVLSIVLIFIYQFGFGIALAPMPWYTSPEMFPPALRPMASSINSMTSWICAFIIIFVYPQMQKGIGDFGAFLFFAADALFALIFGSIVIKEPLQNEDTTENLDDSEENTDSDKKSNEKKEEKPQDNEISDSGEAVSV